jgi:hypothetical protein
VSVVVVVAVCVWGGVGGHTITQERRVVSRLVQLFTVLRCTDVVCFCLRCVSLAVFKRTEVVERLGVLRIARQCKLEALHCKTNVAETDAYVGHIIPIHEHVRIDSFRISVVHIGKINDHVRIVKIKDRLIEPTRSRIVTESAESNRCASNMNVTNRHKRTGLLNRQELHSCGDVVVGLSTIEDSKGITIYNSI